MLLIGELRDPVEAGAPELERSPWIHSTEGLEQEASPGKDTVGP